jgi:hypothetical protein
LFFKQYRPRISEEEISIILGSLRDAISSDGCTSEHCQESLAHLATGQPLIMGLGLSVPPGKGHAIGLVFHNDRCFICNRGYGSGLSGIAIYKFNCADLGPERLLDIGNTRGKTVEEFYQNLVSSQRPVEQIPQKPQKVGNCTWVSMESMFLALLYIVLEKTIPDSGERLKFCKEVYKDFTSFARECSLKEVAGEGKYRNPEILAKLQQKLLSSKRFTENEKKEMLSLLR